jgi:hypothetical protein
MRTPAVSLRALGAGLAVLTAVLALLPHHDAHPPAAAAAPDTEHASANTPDEAAARPPVTANANPAAAAEASLITAFQSAGNLRAFMHEAMRHPERGGVFYALRALSECRRQQGTQFEPEADPMRTLGHGDLVQRAAWAELSLRRCAAFTADDLADGEVQRLIELGAARGDPLAGAYAGWLAAIEQGSIAVLVPAMQRVLDRADPSLLEWVSVAGIDYLEGRRGAGGPLDDVARRRRMDAWALLPCEFGADCTQPDLGAASPCVGAGRCEGGQRAHVFERGGWRTEAERAALAAEVQALKAAVLARDAWAALGLVKP